MVRHCAALVAAVCAYAQPAPFTIDQVLGAAFPTYLTAAPSGGKVAWVSNARGVINIMVAEPPGYVARQITRYSEDDGQDLMDLRWTPDARALIYVRGEGLNRFGEYPNPAIDPRGVEQAVWMVALDGSAPRKIGEGNSPAVSSQDGRVAFVRRGQIWWASLAGDTAPVKAFETRGQLERPTWSPDGRYLAFVSDRGDHSFVGVYDVAGSALRYADPSTDLDSYPEWSPDSRNVAYIRQPSHGRGRVYGAQRADEPWSIHIADATTGTARTLWKAAEGRGSVFRAVVGNHHLLWADAGRLVFPWEGDGWTHLYSIPAGGGAVVPLTPGDFEVEYVALGPGGREVLFNSNQGDVDRRHLWKVTAKSGPPQILTSGLGIEWAPAPTSDTRVVAFLSSGSSRPAGPSILLGVERRDLAAAALPSDFPRSHLVTPQPVTFASADGVIIHGQLFLPPGKAGEHSPAVVFFHGGPQRQMLLGWHYRSYYHNAYAMNQYLANRGYVVLSVNYRSGIGYGLNFREALNFGSTGASEFQDVEAAGAYLRTRSDVDPERIGAWGGSYGGYLTALALARQSEVFRAGVDLHGVHDWSVEYDLPPTDPAAKVAFTSSPMAFVDSWRSPVLLIQGDDDRNVKFNQTVILRDALRQRKVPVEELIFPDEVHEFLLYRHWREAYEAADRFLEKYLLK